MTNDHGKETDNSRKTGLHFVLKSELPVPIRLCGFSIRKRRTLQSFRKEIALSLYNEKGTSDKWAHPLNRRIPAVGGQ
jgi:hypothetical protein